MAPRNDGTAREAGAISLSQVSTNFGHSSARLRRIKKLQFGIINPEELKQYSVTQAITVNGRKIPAGVTRYEVCISNILCVLVICYFRLLETTATYSLNVTDYRPSLVRPATAGTRDAIQDFIRHLILKIKR